MPRDWYRPLIACQSASDCARRMAKPRKRRRAAIVGEMQAQGVRRIEEQLLRSMCQDLVRGRDVERDVTLAGLLLEQLRGELGGVGKGMPHQDASPTAMQGDGGARFFLAVLGEPCLQALIGRRLSAQQSLSIGL